MTSRVNWVLWWFQPESQCRIHTESIVRCCRSDRIKTTGNLLVVSAATLGKYRHYYVALHDDGHSAKMGPTGKARGVSLTIFARHSQIRWEHSHDCHSNNRDITVNVCTHNDSTSVMACTKFGAITLLAFEWERNEISIEFESRWKTLKWNEPCDTAQEFTGL